MNTYPGVLGRKVGMSQVVSPEGEVTPVSVIEARCLVVGKRTQAKDGYDALVLGLGERKASRTSKPLSGQYSKSGVSPRQILREFRCSAEHAAQFEVGQEMPLGDLFAEGQFVDVRGVSRGRGFSGVMRRHNFGGAGASHGAHEYKRHGGSIGTNMTPGRVLPGRKMAGQHGNKTVSVLNQRIVQVLPEKGLLLVHGGVPGARGGLVEIRGAVKKRNGGRPAA